MKDLWNYGEPYDSYPIDTARLRKVVELVADKGGWGRSVPKGHGLGIAAHRSFVSYIATIVEVAVDDKGKLTVPRVDTAIDCGTYVNPERIQSQIEGAAIMGLSLAKYGEITFKDGKVQQGNFDDFPVIRMDEVPGRDQRLHRAARARHAAQRRRRAGRAAVRAGADQRDLRRHRQAHPRAADRQAIGGVRGTLDRTRRFHCLTGVRSMKPNSTALAVSLLSSVLLLNAQAATAQTTSPPSATATRPATTPPGQTSIPNESPPATTTQTTGEASRDPVVKKMNEDEKQKVDTKGK